MIAPIRLVVADDHPLVLCGLEHLLSTQPDFTVLATCEDGNSVLPTVREHQPDILLLDLRMPGMDGLDILRVLRDEGMPHRVVILTAAINEDDVLESIRLGVRGVVLKEMPPQSLLQCLRTVHAGGEWLEKRSVSRALEKLFRKEAGAEQLADILTPREIELIRVVAQGLSNKDIATNLHISEGTVKIHLHNIYEKLKLRGRVSLTLFAQQVGIA